MDQEKGFEKRRDALSDDPRARPTPLGLGPIRAEHAIDEATIDEATINEATLESASEAASPAPAPRKARAALPRNGPEGLEETPTPGPSSGSRWSVDVEEERAGLSERLAVQHARDNLPSAFRPGPTQGDLTSPKAPLDTTAAPRRNLHLLIVLVLAVLACGVTLFVMVARDSANQKGPVTVAAPQEPTAPPAEAAPDPLVAPAEAAPEPPVRAAEAATEPPAQSPPPKAEAANPPLPAAPAQPTKPPPPKVTAAPQAPPPPSDFPPPRPRPVEGAPVF